MTPTGTDTRRRPAPRAGATGPAVDPRIRARRAAVTRTAGRRRLRLVLVVLVVLGVVLVGWLLLHSRLLAARVVRVEGSVHTPSSEIVEVAGLAGHPPMIDVDPGAAAARLERLPWVSSATVSRDWPDGVVISVVERSPVAVVATTATSSTTTAPASTTTTTTTTTAPGAAGTGTGTGTGTGAGTAPKEPWALVDREGRVLADVASPPAGLVHLDVAAVPGAPGTALAGAAAPGLEVAASLPKAFASQVTTVVVGAGGQVTLDMTTPVTVALGTATQLDKKYEDAAAVLAGAHLVAGDVIDVGIPDSPTVGPG